MYIVSSSLEGTLILLVDVALFDKKTADLVHIALCILIATCICRGSIFICS
jgi:hypothetical protein